MTDQRKPEKCLQEISHWFEDLTEVKAFCSK